jgi:hypothetical protein
MNSWATGRPLRVLVFSLVIVAATQVARVPSDRTARRNCLL